MIQVALVQVLAPVNGPGISERTLPGDRVAEPRWSFILEPGRERKLASWGEGGPAGLKLVLIVKPTRAIVLAAVESCKK